MKRLKLGRNVTRGLICAALACASLGCQQSAPQADAEAALDPALSQYVLSELPSDVPNRTYIDFGGKVALVGYAIEPTGVAAPGSHVKLTLYWQSLGKLGPGWGLFTHLVIPRKPHRLLDSAGPLRKSVANAGGGERQALGPSAWEVGKVYVDPLEFDIPPDVRVPELTIVAGVWHDALRVIKDGEQEDPKLALPGLRLPVLSGAVDDMERAIVMHIETGIPAQAPPTVPSAGIKAPTMNAAARVQAQHGANVAR
ncbi:MAG TPA: hypothetical protein VGM44_11615 [Polyangiaceae bacterium]|jgi:hypothetical protein